MVDTEFARENRSKLTCSCYWWDGLSTRFTFLMALEVANSFYRVSGMSGVSGAVSY